MDKRLKSKKVIDKLFVKGLSKFTYPIKAVYMHSTDMSGQYGIQAGVSVSKKSFKRAVDRNLIKRRMRESLRLHTTLFEEKEYDHYLAIMYIYVGKDILESKVIDHGIRRVSKLILDIKV